jgi:type IV secretory pathway TraG/TraD family ATPase VirD4
MAAAPRPRTRIWRDLGASAALVSLWIGPWFILTLATWIAGGHPGTSPVAFINPGEAIRRVSSGSGPFEWWVLVAPESTVVAWKFWVSLALIVGGVAGCGLGVRMQTARLSRGRFKRFLPPARRVSRTAHWARGVDLRTLRARPGRNGVFLLGRHGHRALVTQRETSVLVIGPTRSGKTAGLVIPNLLEWDGPAIATSTKSELVDVTAGRRQAMGPVYVYDPTGESGGGRVRTVTWSPIAGCDDLDRAWMVASWLCASLQQGGGRGDNDWSHWAESGKLLIAPLLYVAAVTGRTIVDVRTWIHGFDVATPITILEDMLLDPSILGDADPIRAMSMLASIDQRPERERGTVFSTVMRIFNVFTERAVAESALSSRFDPDEFLRRRGTLYLCTPRQTPERIASLFVGILMTVVTAAYALSETDGGRRTKAILGLFLDELANVVPIEDLPALASQGAGRGVMLMSIVQDLSQLRARYGNAKANTILNNHGCKLILPGISDPETADVLAKLVGRSDFTEQQVSLGADGRVSRSYSVRHDAIATPDALRQLSAGTAIVIHRESPPALVSLPYWFRSRRYRRLARMPYFRGAEHVPR